jgi:hypothetical protein
MVKLKSLNKKLLRLEASLQKDARKLAKLKRKVETALRAESAPATVTSPVQVEEAPKAARISAPVVKGKKRSGLTSAGRDKLSALMKARWAAKRAGTAPAGEPRRAAA